MLQKEVLEISRQAPGAENPDTLAAFEIYAPILSKLGRLGKAEPLQRSARHLRGYLVQVGPLGRG